MLVRMEEAGGTGDHGGRSDGRVSYHGAGALIIAVPTSSVPTSTTSPPQSLYPCKHAR